MHGTRHSQQSQTTMNALQKVFNGQDIRIIPRDGECQIVGPDLADALGYSKTSNMSGLVFDEWKGTAKISTPGGPQRVLVIHEQGLYQILGRSNKDACEPFQRWFYGDVIPQIRQTGGYNADETEEANARPKTPIDRALDLKAQIQSLRSEIRERQQKIDTRQQQLDKAKAALAGGG